MFLKNTLFWKQIYQKSISKTIDNQTYSYIFCFNICVYILISSHLKSVEF